MIQPYVNTAKGTYPEAKLRWELGLSKGHRFFVTTDFHHSEDLVESIFVQVQRIDFQIIYGRIASEAMGPGIRRGDPYEFNESEVSDWTIQHPDGTEEGNFIGKFYDLYPGKCPTDFPDRTSCDYLYVVVAGIIVDPTGELAKVELMRPVNCDQDTVPIIISDAWKKTACAVLTMRELAPTHKSGKEPAMKYIPFVYNSERPHVVYPREGAGESADNPVVYVREEILEEQSDPPGVCDGNLDGPAA